MHGCKQPRADTQEQAGCFIDRLRNALLLQDNKGYNKLKVLPSQLEATRVLRTKFGGGLQVSGQVDQVESLKVATVSGVPFTRNCSLDQQSWQHRLI